MKLILAAILGLSIVGCTDSETVATVNGYDISKNEFQNYLESKGVKSKTISTQKTVLESYARRVAMTKAIEKQDKVPMDKINQQVADYRQQLLMNAYFDSLISENVTEESIKNYYSGNADEFEKIKAKVSHILFRVRPGMTEEEVKVVKLKAFEASSKLKSGSEFSDLAQSLSDDKLTSKKGGDMGWVKQGGIDPVFSDTVFSLKAGEISEPVRSAFGFHIILLQESPKTIKAEFSDVKGEIRHRLKAKAKQAELDRLMEDYSFEVHEEILANL